LAFQIHIYYFMDSAGICTELWQPLILASHFVNSVCSLPE